MENFSQSSVALQRVAADIAASGRAVEHLKEQKAGAACTVTNEASSRRAILALGTVASARQTMLGSCMEVDPDRPTSLPAGRFNG